MNELLRCAMFCVITAAAAHVEAEYSVSDIVGAAKLGDGHAVHRLLEIDPDRVRWVDANGYTALHWAAIRGHWRIVAELVAAGAPVNAIGADGGTPLHWACHHDRADMVVLLLDAGADLDIQNRWGRTPLHTAARRGCREVAAVLISRGANLEAATHEGWTPLHVAYKSGHDDLVALLLARGADPAATDHDGLRPSDGARPRPAEITLDPRSLDEYSGIYDLGGGFSVKVWRDGDRLAVREFAPDLLYPIGPDQFFCRQEPWRLRFSRSDLGIIDGVDVDFLRRSVRGERTPSPRYVGSAVCGDCHRDQPHGGPWVAWLSSRHSQAYWRLATDWALYLARLRPYYADLEDPRTDDRCLLCHVAGRQDDNSLFSESFRPQEGVSCEACHGPGSLYAEVGVMTNRERFVDSGGVIPDQTTCVSCHRNSERFDFAEWWPKIAHGGPPDSPVPSGSHPGG